MILVDAVQRWLIHSYTNGSKEWSYREITSLLVCMGLSVCVCVPLWLCVSVSFWIGLFVSLRQILLGFWVVFLPGHTCTGRIFSFTLAGSCPWRSFSRRSCQGNLGKGILPDHVWGDLPPLLLYRTYEDVWTRWLDIFALQNL